MLVFWAGIHKMLVRVANRDSEHPDQSASSSEEAASSGSALFVYAFLAGK